MTPSRRISAPIFSAADLLRTINLAHEVASGPFDPRLVAVRAVCQIRKLIDAEGGCLQSVQRTEFRKPTLSPIHLDDWSPADDRTIGDLSYRQRKRLSATEPVKARTGSDPRLPQLYYVASTRSFYGGEEQVLAFKRFSRPFDPREQALLQTLHRSLLLVNVNHSNCSDRGHLSARKSEVLTHLVSGRSEKQIATELSISRHTVHVHVKAIYRKYQVNSRAELIARSMGSTPTAETAGSNNGKSIGVNHSARAE